MSQVPPNDVSFQSRPPGYVILDTPDITPLGQILRLLHAPEEVSAVLVLRNKQTGALSSVTIVSITHVDHERQRGAVFFGGTLEDRRHIEAHVFATPQGEDREVLGTAVITPNQRGDINDA